MRVKSSPTAIYIHIPFCPSKCYYCDFTAYLIDGYKVDDYLHAIDIEMQLLLSEFPASKIDSVFVGGGTPTILTVNQMQQFLSMLKSRLPGIDSKTEFTIEANPGTVNKELLSLMFSMGVNRLSFGVQTFNPRLLKEIGRSHTIEDIVAAVSDAQEVGFNNISLDLIFGLPKQSLQDVEQALIHGLQLKPTHFSCYSLKVEEGTPFHRLQKLGQLYLPTEDDEVAMYHLLRSLLPRHGYTQYEVSNFALPGKESKHNITYWENKEYYGIGCGAHGHISNIRYANETSVKGYIDIVMANRRPIKESYTVSGNEQMENFMMLGLRLIKGVNCKEFSTLYNKNIDEVFGNLLTDLTTKGLLKVEGNLIKLTEKGLIFGNEVFGSFVGYLT